MIKMHFPMINEDYSYLDNAATTQKPTSVIETVKNYYEEMNANVNRGLYELSERATRLFGNARKTVEVFVNAERVVFTKNATESLNLVAYGLTKGLTKKDNVVTTVLEHHSNFLPWKVLCEEKNIDFRVAGLKDEKLDEEEFLSLIDKNTKIIALTYVSNSIGIKQNIKKLVPLIRKKCDAKIVLDANQAVPHFEVDMKKLGVDFLAFSGHKMYGPTGIGVLAASRKEIESLPKFLYGGDMVKTVTSEKVEYNDDVQGFEAGTPNVAGAIGLAAAIDFMKRTGMENIRKQEKELMGYAISEMKKIDCIKIYGTNEVSVIGFTMSCAHPHDIATILDEEGVAIRAGHHCAQPSLEALGVKATARISLGMYNDKKDIDRLIKGLLKVKEVFK